MIKTIITIVGLLTILMSCENPANDEVTLKSILPGVWKNKVEGSDTEMNFIVSGNDIILDGSVYNGVFTDSTYSGHYENGNLKQDILIKMVTVNKIIGNRTTDFGDKKVIFEIDAYKIE